MQLRRLLFPFLVLLILLAASVMCAQELPNLPPLSPADLTLKDNPAAPGSPAIILYMAVETDNLKATEAHSFRIKIFKEEGKKYANVEIPYLDRETRIEEIRARSIDTDGKVREFTEGVFDREVLRGKKYRVKAKVFAIPDVQVGTIIEYSYRYHFHIGVPDWLRDPNARVFQPSFVYPAAHWTIQRNLFLRHGQFLLRRAKGLEIHSHEIPLPNSLNKEPSKASKILPSEKNSPLFLTQRLPNGTVLLEVDNIPAFEEEEFTWPEESLKASMDLYYASSSLSVDGFWASMGRRYADYYEEFMDKPKAMRKEVDKLVSSGDTEEAKVRKIYARVQLIKTADAEGRKSDKELKQEKLKDNNNVEDVLTRGYAFGHQVNLLFVALARAAGFTAYPILLTSRLHGEFMKDYPDESQLNTMVVSVHFNNAMHFYDPGALYCPFDLLPWYESGAQGVIIARSGSHAGTIPYPKIEDARIRLDAELQLSSEGSVSGDVKVDFQRQEAFVRRQAAVLEDEVKRRESLEDYLKDRLPSEAGVKLVSVRGWDTSEGSLHAEYAVEIPNVGTPAGRRMILPQAIFHTKGKNPLTPVRRVYPIVFDYPSEVEESVRIKIPADLRVEALPAAYSTDQGAATYNIFAQKDETGALIKRRFKLASCVFDQDVYSNLRLFYERVATGDAQQIALRHTENAASH